MILARMLRNLLILTAALLGILLALGLRLQLQRRARGGRWLHHLLFFVVTALTALLALLRALGHQLYWPLLLPAALLLAMPLTKPGRAGHWRLALAVAVAFGWAAWQVW